jgi:nicotinate dehydrogenase subunit A
VAVTGLRVNGVDHQFTSDPQTPLLLALRGELGLVGTRFGCGLGLCGACNVLVDGVPVHSCDTPLWAVAGRDVVTVEGLGTPEEPHPVQRAFLDERALQCGFCGSGMVVSAAALLAGTPDATEADIRAALDANLCRCGAHNRIVRAITRARDGLR